MYVCVYVCMHVSYVCMYDTYIRMYHAPPALARVQTPGQQQRKRGAGSPTCALGAGGPGGDGGRGAGGGICCWVYVCIYQEST